MLGKSGTLYLAHMNMEGMEPTVGSKFPFNVRIRGGLNPSPLGEDLSMVCGYGELS